ncbi:MAG: hypothetical protein ABIR18_13035, partial [Chitinophagaceae bacterium]
FALFTTAASAQRGKDVTQHQRIHNGVKSGQLTRGEKFRLHKNEARYHHAKRRSMHDGRLTRGERKRLNHLKRHDSRRIYAMKHNTRRKMF